MLVAYPYFKTGMRKMLESRDPSTFRLIVDSGAFTAWNMGREISLTEYMEFLKTIPKEWDYRAVQLDVYGNPEASYVNWQKMLDAGFGNIMPVFTRGDTVDRLEQYYAATDYIMFGGIAIGGSNKNYIKWFLDQNKGRKAHWLGFTNIDFVKHYKPESVDSSSHSAGQMFGSIDYYAGGGRLMRFHREAFAKRPPEAFVAAARRTGYTMAEIGNLAKVEAWRGQPEIPGTKTHLKGLSAFFTYTSYVYRMVEVERNVGTKMYHAFTATVNLKRFFQAHDFMVERGAIK